MGKLRSYVLSNLTILFFSIFFPLFAIASVVFMIKLANYTAVIQLTFWEMSELYLFVLPELFFYTLPIAFVIGSTLTLYRLSQDNETVAVFSLGVSPLSLGRILVKPAALLSFLLLVDFLLVTPYIKVISANFVDQKRAEAKFNLTASEFGHKFGDWMLFINKSDQEKRTYEDVILYNKVIRNEIVLTAKSAELINNDGFLQLRLNHGESFSYDDEGLKEMVFETAMINDVLTSRQMVYRDPVEYWTNDELRDRKDQRLVSNTLFSLFPFLSIFLILALGIVHARHQKRWIYLWLFASVIVYYASTVALQQVAGFHAIWIVAVGWLLLTYLLYRRMVGSRF